MLILQRKKGESIVIGSDIIVSVSDVGTDWVKLAIDAPPTVKVLRSELLEAAQANQEAAMGGGSIMDIKKLLENGREKGES